MYFVKSNCKRFVDTEMMYLSSISSTETYAKVSHFMKKFTLIEFSFVFNWIIVLVGFWYFFPAFRFRRTLYNMIPTWNLSLSNLCPHLFFSHKQTSFPCLQVLSKLFVRINFNLINFFVVDDHATWSLSKYPSVTELFTRLKWKNQC